MIRLVELECPNCGGRIKRIEEDLARCPHCETEFLIDKDQPEKLVYVNEPPQQTPVQGAAVPGAIIVLIVLILLCFLIVWAPIAARKKEADTSDVGQNKRFQSELFEEFVERVYETDCENVTEEQLGKLTHIRFYPHPMFGCGVEYSLDDGPMKQLRLEADLSVDYMDFENFPNLKGIYLETTSLPEAMLDKLGQLTELECNNSPQQLAQHLPAPEKLKKYICHRSENDTMDGVDTFVNLEYLEMDCEYTEDIQAVASLENLKTLMIKSGEEIKDFDALHSLTELEVLHLETEQLRDISFVKDMKQLREFTLKNSGVLDLSPLSEKTELTYLEMENNQEVNDYSILSTLSGLETLHLSFGGETQMPDVSRWSKLTELSVSGADSLEFLAQLPTLKKLNLSVGGNQDLSVLANLTQLNELTFKEITGEMQGFYTVTALNNLKKLELCPMQIYGTIEDIFAIPGLEELDISYCKFGLDVEALPENPSLKRLYMCGVTIWENVQIQQDGFATKVDYDELPMAENIDFVSKFPNLEQLYVPGNKLTDVKFAKNLPKLTHLDVTNNYITDLRPLQDLQRLETVWCGDNSISQEIDLGKDVNVETGVWGGVGTWHK